MEYRQSLQAVRMCISDQETLEAALLRSVSWMELWFLAWCESGMQAFQRIWLESLGESVAADRPELPSAVRTCFGNPDRLCSRQGQSLAHRQESWIAASPGRDSVSSACSSRSSGQGSGAEGAGVGVSVGVERMGIQLCEGDIGV